MYNSIESCSINCLEQQQEGEGVRLDFPILKYLSGL